MKGFIILMSASADDLKQIVVNDMILCQILFEVTVFSSPPCHVFNLHT
jgi:hypothetical protein